MRERPSSSSVHATDDLIERCDDTAEDNVTRAILRCRCLRQGSSLDRHNRFSRFHRKVSGSIPQVFFHSATISFGSCERVSKTNGKSRKKLSQENSERRTALTTEDQIGLEELILKTMQREQNDGAE